MITPFFSKILVLVSSYLIPAEIQHPTRDPASERIVIEMPAESPEEVVEAIYRILVHNYAEDELGGKSFFMVVPESAPGLGAQGTSESPAAPAPALYLTEFGVKALLPNTLTPTIARWRLSCA